MILCMMSANLAVSGNRGAGGEKVHALQDGIVPIGMADEICAPHGRKVLVLNGTVSE